MIKGEKPAMVENENAKKVPNKKEVEPNLYSLCLNIDHFYLPATPNLEHIFNYLNSKVGTKLQPLSMISNLNLASVLIFKAFGR